MTQLLRPRTFLQSKLVSSSDCLIKLDERAILDGAHIERGQRLMLTGIYADVTVTKAGLKGETREDDEGVTLG